ncbi:hypothetical protein CRG98_007709 [Punica granatum]|uniref:Uncharacterized protein n=1 Tax=Punica granatum TaxID=22663 RepID=A0A2I0KTW0_PUNGR|nr:hypothetical protein CRG98_007709 [Punica granatum]
MKFAKIAASLVGGGNAYEGIAASLLQAKVEAEGEAFGRAPYLRRLPPAVYNLAKASTSNYRFTPPPPPSYSLYSQLAGAGKNFAGRDRLLEIEATVRPGGRKMMFSGLMLLEFAAAFHRLRGANVLLPFAFHCTGMPIKVAADKLAREAQQLGDPPASFPKKEEEQVNQEADASDDTAYEPWLQDNFKGKKSKAAAKSGGQLYQWEIMRSVGLSDSDISRLQNPPIMSKHHWPRGFRCNGHLMLNNEKMSKQTGNFKTLREAIKEFSADATRFSLADAGDSIDDANFVSDTANAAILRLTKELSWMEEVIAADSSLRSGPPSTYADRVFANEINIAIKMTEQHYQDCMFREALKTGFYDLQAVRDEYRFSCSSGGMNHELVWRFMDVQTRLIAPFCPHYAEWQMRKLKSMGKIVKDVRYTIYSPLDGQPCGDHDRTSGEGVRPQDYTLIKMEVVPPFPPKMGVLDGKKVCLAAATLRPETMYGQTNAWVLPEGQYGAFEVNETEVFIISHRAARNLAYQGFSKIPEKPSCLLELTGSSSRYTRSGSSQLGLKPASGYWRVRPLVCLAVTIVSCHLDANDSRHPLDKQNTLILRTIAGLNDLGKAPLRSVTEQVMLLENIATSVLVSKDQVK